MANRRRSRRQRQGSLAFPSTWGGRRKGAGRKRKNRSAVSRAARPELNPRHPLHVTMRLSKGVWSLRSRRSFRVIEKALRAGSDRLGMRLTHYTVQGNHLHLVVEADDKKSLSRGMQGLTIRLAKGLNRLMGRSGKVFEDRYHARALRNPREVRSVIRYVLDNARRHGLLPRTTPHDSFAGGRGLDGQIHPTLTGEPPPVAPPTTWLLRVGWMKEA